MAEPRTIFDSDVSNFSIVDSSDEDSMTSLDELFQCMAVFVSYFVLIANKSSFTTRKAELFF